MSERSDSLHMKDFEKKPTSLLNDSNKCLKVNNNFFFL